MARPRSAGDKLKAGENVQADLTALGLKVDTHTGVSRFAQRWIRTW